MGMRPLVESAWSSSGRSSPDGLWFLELLLSKTGAGKLIRHRAEYYLLRCLQEYTMLEYSTSLLACSAFALAIYTGSPRVWSWTKELAHFTGYGLSDLKVCATSMRDHVKEDVVTQSGRRLDAVKRMYARHVYMRVAGMDPELWTE